MMDIPFVVCDVAKARVVVALHVADKSIQQRVAFQQPASEVNISYLGERKRTCLLSSGG